jgi:hypothetical protein
MALGFYIAGRDSGRNAKAGYDSGIVDGQSVDKMQWRVRGNQRVEINH